MLTVVDVQAEVARIASLADDEKQHSCEDELFRLVLTAIADGTIEDAAACSAAALKSWDSDFARWCA